jgi:hypothetical protein
MTYAYTRTLVESNFKRTYARTQSIEKLERSLEIFPDNHNALVVMGSALNARGIVVAYNTQDMHAYAFYVYVYAHVQACV